MFIHKIVNTSKRFFPIHHAYSLLFGMLGSMIILTVYHYTTEKPNKIAVVNVTAIVTDFIKNETKQNKPKDVLTNETKQFGIELEKTIKEEAKNNHVILMPSQAIFAGSQDYTPLIKLKMRSFIKNKWVESNDQ